MKAKRQPQDKRIVALEAAVKTLTITVAQIIKTLKP